MLGLRGRAEERKGEEGASREMRAIAAVGGAGGAESGPSDRPSVWTEYCPKQDDQVDEEHGHVEAKVGLGVVDTVGEHGDPREGVDELPVAPPDHISDVMVERGAQWRRQDHLRGRRGARGRGANVHMGFVMAVQSHAAFCALLELTPAEAMEVVHNFPLDPVQERPVPAAVEGKLDDAVAEELEVLQLDRGQTVGLFEGPLGKVVPSTVRAGVGPRGGGTLANPP